MRQAVWAAGSILSSGVFNLACFAAENVDGVCVYVCVCVCVRTHAGEGERVRGGMYVCVSVWG